MAPACHFAAAHADADYARPLTAYAEDYAYFYGLHAIFHIASMPLPLYIFTLLPLAFRHFAADDAMPDALISCFMLTPCLRHCHAWRLLPLLRRHYASL